MFEPFLDFLAHPYTLPLIGICLLCCVVFTLLTVTSSKKRAKSHRFSENFWLNMLSWVGVVVAIPLITAVLFAFAQIFMLALHFPTDADDQDALRFHSSLLTTMLAVIVAIFGLVFAFSRLFPLERQTRSAEKKIELETLSLFEDRLQNALSNLSARYDFKGLGRNVSNSCKQDKPTYFHWHSDRSLNRENKKNRYSEWQTFEQTKPDVELRVAGISQLEGMAREYDTEQSRRIRTLLNGYLRQNVPLSTASQSPSRYYDEISQGAGSEQQVYDTFGVWPNIADSDNVREWGGRLEMRDDTNQAMFALGRLGKVEKNPQFSDLLDKVEDRQSLRQDFSRLNLQAMVLRDSKFNGSSFESSEMAGIDFLDSAFVSCILRAVYFEVSKAAFCFFEHSDLSHSEWILADWQQCVFDFCRLKSAMLHQTHLANCSFHSVGLNYTRFTQSDLSGVKFSYCQFVKTEFSLCYLASCKFENCETLELATFDRVGLHNIDLSMTAITREQVECCFGDSSVALPDGLERPTFWPDWALPPDLHHAEWIKWRSRGQRENYVPPHNPTQPAKNPP